MPINSIDQTTKTTPSSDAVFNPKSKLDSEAFMKLFIAELEHQDPTKPMDTDKMLEQTSQMSALESNQKLQETLTKLTTKLAQSQTLNSINAIGKMGDTGNRYVNVTDKSTSKSFDLYFGNDIQKGNVIIKDKSGNIVKTIPVNAHSKGVLNFTWDLTDANGKRVPSNTYNITAKYTSQDGKSHNTALGAYPIESVKFDKGEALAKLGGSYVPFSQIKEIYDWEG